MDQRRLEIVIEARNRAKAAFNELIGSSGQLKTAIKSLGIEAQTLRMKLATAIPESDDAIAYAKALQTVEQRMRLLQQVSTDSQARLTAFAGSMKRFGTTMTLAVTTPLALMGRQMWQNYQDMESLQVGLKAVVGSQEEMQRQWKAVERIAKLPGLGIEEAAQGLTALQAAGLDFKASEDALMGFGNALAQVGKGKAELGGVMLALTQMASKTKISAEEVNRQLAQYVPQIRKAMQQIWGTADAEQLNKMGVTPGDFIAKISQQLKQLPQVGQTAKNTMENLNDSIKKLSLSVGEIMAPVMEKLAGWVTKAAEAFKSLSPQMQKAAVYGLAVLAVIGPLALGLSQLPAIIAGVKIAVHGLTVALTFLAAHPVVLAIGVIVAALGGLAYAWWKATKGTENYAKAQWEAARQQASDAGYVDIESMYRAKLQERKPGWDVDKMEQSAVIDALSAADRKAVWEEYRAAIQARKAAKTAPTGVKMTIEGGMPTDAKKEVDEWARALQQAKRAEKDAVRELSAIAGTKGLEGFALREKEAQITLKQRLEDLEAEKKLHLPVLDRIKLAYGQFQQKMREISADRKRQLQEWEDAETEARESARYIRLGIGKEGADLMELEARQELERSKRALDKLAKEGQPIAERRGLAQAQYDAAMAAAGIARDQEAKENQRKSAELARQGADAAIREAQAYQGLRKAQGAGLSDLLAGSQNVIRAEEDRLVLLRNQLEIAKAQGDTVAASGLQAEIYESMANIRNAQNSNLGLVVKSFKDSSEMASGWMNYLKQWGGSGAYRESVQSAIGAQADLVNALTWAQGQVAVGSDQWQEYSKAILESVGSMQQMQRSLDDLTMREVDAGLGAMKAFRDMNRAAGVDTRQTSAQIIRMERDKLALLQQQLAVAEALGQVETAENLRRSIFELRREIMQTAQAQTRWISITDIWRQSMERAATSRVRLSPAFATGQSGQIVVQENPALVGAINQLSGVIREWAGNYLG